MFDNFSFDLRQAWNEIQLFYDYLKHTYITWWGASISLWALICSAYVAISLLDVFLFFFKTNGDISDNDYIDD